MKILLTEHAKEGLKEREIEIPGHWLIVVYNKREDEIEVITIIDTSKSIEKIIERRLSSKRWIEV